jgi:hypothetical protein
MQHKRRSLVLFLILFMLTAFTTAAWAVGGAVIPLWRTPKPLQNIVTVALSGGDFTDPVAAVASITDASETNPYMVYIAPGVYTLTKTLEMKEYVDVRGSGQNVTELKGAISEATPVASGIVKLANNSVLASLSILNEGTGANSVAVVADGLLSETAEAPRLEQVKAGASKGTTNYGAYFSGSSVRVMDSDLEAVGGTTAYGMRTVGTSGKTVQLLVERSYIAVNSASDANVAISAEDTALVLDTVKANASKGANHTIFAASGTASGSVSEYLIWIRNSLFDAGDGSNDTENIGVDCSGALKVQLERTKVLAANATTDSVGVKTNITKQLLLDDVDLDGATHSLNSLGSNDTAINESLLSGAVAVNGNTNVTRSLLDGTITTAGSTTTELMHVVINGTVVSDGDVAIVNTVLASKPTTTGTQACVHSSVGTHALDGNCDIITP